MSENIILNTTLDGHSSGVTSVAFNNFFLWLATGSLDKTAKLWSFSLNDSMANCMVTMAGQTTSVTSVAFHPTKPILVTGSHDNTAKLWQFSPDGSTAICVAILEGHSNSVTSVAFHPHNILLATGSGDKTAKLWRLSSVNSSATCVATLVGHSGSVTSVAFHPTAPLLATGSTDCTAKLWRFSSYDLAPTCVATLGEDDNYVWSVDFHQTAPFLATSSSNSTAKLWHFSSYDLAPTCVATILVDNSEGNIWSVAFHPKVLLLATGSSNSTAKVWRFSSDGSTVTCVATLAGHSKDVRSVVFHSTEPFLATGSLDNTTKIWKLNNQNLSIFPSNLSAFALRQNRQSVSSASASSNLSRLTISNNHSGGIIINIPRELRLEPKNSANKSCPNFKRLYDKFMLINLDKPFKFKFIGESAIDLKGLTKIVYDFLLPVYTNLYFKDAGEAGGFILLKENVSITTLFKETFKIIKLAEAALSQFYLQIHPKVVELLLSPNPPENIAKRQNFNRLYSNFEKQIKKLKNTNKLFNVSNFLMNNKYKSVINSQENLNSSIKSEILFRKALSDYGFVSWKQYENMKTFITTFWDDSIKLKYHNKGKNVEVPLFSCELKYDIESFKKRLQIKKEYTSNLLNLDEVKSFYEEYPALHPLLDYILDSGKNGDANRRKFVKYVAGTEYTFCTILILLGTLQIPFYKNKNKLYEFYELPFKAQTCFSTLNLFKTPPNYQEKWTVERINEEITKGSRLAAHN